MNSSPQLIYPTVDLFLYDLADGLGQSNEQIQENRRRFWQRIYQDSLRDQKLAELQDAEIPFDSYIELLGAEKIERFKYPLDGYYYPVKLGDTYALQIDCSGKENEPDGEQLSLEDKLGQIKDIILEHTHKIPGEMGENWLVWGKLAMANQDPKATAQYCYNALQLLPHAKWQRNYQGEGKFQGATCFELGQIDIIPDGLNRNQYILICLFAYDTTDGEMATEKFLSHIHSDYQTLKAGLNPLETCIKTIAGIIEIEKTKNERALNQTVAIASVGISTASLAASALTEQAEGIVKSILPVPANQPTPALNHWANFSLTFGLSVLIGIVSALITWRILDIGRTR